MDNKSVCKPSLVLVTMPWHGLEYPSTALGILKAQVEAKRPDWTVEDVYGGIAWARFLLDATNMVIRPRDYTDVAERVFDSVGDWVFTSALYDSDAYHAPSFARYLSDRGIDPTIPLRMQRLAPTFISQMARDLLAKEPTVIGFSTTFMQSVPSLALAKELKRLAPLLPIIFGGANCEGIQGKTMHQKFRQIDFVVRGEGELALVDLLECIWNGHGFEKVDGLSWRRPVDGNAVHNNTSALSIPMDEVPTPDYSTFYSELENSAIAEYVRPKLALEAARGCWWGQRRQCTFCGLNGQHMGFRSKSATRVFEEIAYLTRRYRLLDIVVVDNILDTRYLKELMPALEQCDWDLRIHYEVKSNLNPSELAVLRRAGVVHVQPGIESLKTSILKLMRKGVSGVQNVIFLRSAEELGLTAEWNLLYGFAGEDPRDYDAMIDQFDNLVHLQPPSGAQRIALERFSPIFDDPALGFA